MVFDAGPTLKQYRFNAFYLLVVVVLYAPQSCYVIDPQYSPVILMLDLDKIAT